MNVETLWQATAATAPTTAALEGDKTVEFTVIGSGFCGLNAALELAEAGREVAVIDALPLGAGASGRAGGFVSSRFRMAPETVLKNHGPEALATLQRLSREAVEQVTNNVNSYDLKAARLIRHGSITAASNQQHLKRLLKALRQPQSSYSPSAEVKVLSREEMTAETGSKRFVGGLLTPSGRGLHPLNYTFGLASAAINKGVAIHSDTCALQVVNDASCMRIVTPRGTIQSKKLIIATNAYSLTTPATVELAKGVIPFRSAVIATERLSTDHLATILPGERMMFDTKRLLRWFRVVDGRLVVGGRGAGSPAADADAYRHLKGCMLEAFPQLAAVKIDYQWSGYVGITLEGLPHVGPISDRVFIAGGCNGNGVATASLLGRYAARFAKGEKPDVGILHVDQMKRLPFHRYAGAGVRIATKGFKLLDMIGI